MDTVRRDVEISRLELAIAVRANDSELDQALEILCAEQRIVSSRPRMSQRS
jgi:hypothetical protein